MIGYQWKSEEIEGKFHVLQWYPGCTDYHTIAVCTGPVPAGDIVKALTCCEQLEKVRNDLARSAKQIEEVANGHLASITEKYRVAHENKGT